MTVFRLRGVIAELPQEPAASEDAIREYNAQQPRAVQLVARPVRRDDPEVRTVVPKKVAAGGGP